jgi:hypothetical protein
VAGLRVDPPESVHTASGESPAATALAAPPDETPEVRSRFHGLRVMPYIKLSVTPLQANSERFVIPI